MNNIEEEFVSTLSHEIRTPLTSIKGFSQTMLSNWDKLADDKKKEFLNIILNQSQRLINLCENVLNVAKIDSSKENFVFTKTEINQLVQSCIKIISMNYKDFEFSFNQSKTPLYSYCDSDKVQQVVLNILDNALKYSQNSKKIEIETVIINDFNVISIKNFGSFIKKEDIEKIFEKFYRVDTYIKSSTQGSGLGLYIASNLINKMNGKIEVNSSEEKLETEFSIYLPVYEVEKLTEKAAEKLTKTTGV